MLKACDKTPFDVSSIPELSPESCFVVGYTLFPPNSDLFHCLCPPFSTFDFNHCKHREFGGVLGSRYALNESKVFVDLVHVRLLFNEDESTWNI